MNTWIIFTEDAELEVRDLLDMKIVYMDTFTRQAQRPGTNNYGIMVRQSLIESAARLRIFTGWFVLPPC
jgi:hypothetical protein